MSLGAPSVSTSTPKTDHTDEGGQRDRHGPGRPRADTLTRTPTRPQIGAASVRAPALVAEILRDYGVAIRGALARYLPSGVPERYLYDLLVEYPGRKGKMMRPSICIATARAFGASLEQALCSAVAIELLHNALLIHDDIQDGSVMRRGSPTLHVLHGVPLAINAGDSLLLLSLRPLLDNIRSVGSLLAERILRETERMAWESAEGQAMELGWRRDNSVDLAERDYLVMAFKKTAWLGVIHPMRVGALIGTRREHDLDRFIPVGFFLGVAFQIQDDLLNFRADVRYGKEPYGDLYEGKRTLMLIHALRHAKARERRKLTELLARPREERQSDDIAWMHGLLQECGSIDYASSFAHALAGAALHECSTIFDSLPESRDKAFIQSLATWVLERT
jgi:geranylgeranyl diphosphate synthase, type II